MIEVIIAIPWMDWEWQSNSQKENTRWPSNATHWMHVTIQSGLAEHQASSIEHQAASGIKHQAWGIKPEASSTEPPRIKHKVSDWDGRSNSPLHRNTGLHRNSGNVDPTPKKTCVWYEIWCPSNFSTFYLNRSSFFVVPRPTHHHPHPRQPLTRRNLATLSMC